jgi:hypothetical protein
LPPCLEIGGGRGKKKEMPHVIRWSPYAGAAACYQPDADERENVMCVDERENEIQKKRGKEADEMHAVERKKGRKREIKRKKDRK